MRFATFLLIFSAAFTSFAGHDHEEHEKLIRRHAEAKRAYAAAQADLQRVTDKRWSQRKQQIDQKAAVSRQAENVEHEIERMYTIIARIREENIIREGALSEAKTALGREEDSFEWTRKAMTSLVRKEENSIREALPLNQQQRALELQRVTEAVMKNGSVIADLQRFNSYLNQWLGQTVTIEAGRHTILTADDTPHEITAIRFGSAFALGVGDTAACWYLSHTASNASNPFEWIRLTDEGARKNIIDHMPGWLKSGRVSGPVHVDVMQNKYSEELLAARNMTITQTLLSTGKKGGLIMIPLMALCLWALLLIINRLVVFSIAHSRDNKFIDQAVDYLNNRKMAEASALASRSKGVLARILKTCLNHAQWKRPAAEKAVREFLLAEVPVLDKHLDSLAVIAGAAPLLGLFGTVTGMIRMFESITRFGTGDPRLLAGGISEALVTTEVGLAIAIPVLLVHNFLRNRRNHIQADMEMYAMRILNRLWPQE